MDWQMKWLVRSLIKIAINLLFTIAVLVFCFLRGLHWAVPIIVLNSAITSGILIISLARLNQIRARQRQEEHGR